ncbi:MAG: hypothetical protein JXJ20_14080 [Anaerolineae bacterium]|nr:hypothetical protein [Anaerolineae bacterium]
MNNVLSAGQPAAKARPSPWPRRILIAGLTWAVFLLIIAPVSEPTPESWTLSVSVVLSGLYTLLLYATRRRWLPRLSRRPLRNAMLLGILNAAWIETLFLVVQVIFGAEDVAAHPNLLVDLLITMPWYIGMVILFVRVYHRRRFSPAVVLLLGGLYEVGADGIVGGVGNFANPAYPLLLFLVAFWEFIPVYSSMVLPPAWVVDTIPPPGLPLTPAWRDALRPLLWLIPFAVYLLIVLLVLAALNAV